MGKKLGLVLGAGGARGVAHIGFLQVLWENGIRPHSIAGSSAGSVVGACLGAGLSPQEMYAHIQSLRKSEVLEPIPRLSSNGLFSTKRVEHKLRSVIGNKRICDLSIDFCCVGTDLLSGEAKVFEGNYDTVRAITASSCIPGIFEPVTIGGRQYIDGGLVRRLPVDAVKRFEPDVIVAVDVFTREASKEEFRTVASVLGRAFEIMDQENTDSKTEREKPDLLILPKLTGMSQYSFKNLDNAYYEGYQAGIENIKEIKKLLEE